MRHGRSWKETISGGLSECYWENLHPILAAAAPLWLFPVALIYGSGRRVIYSKRTFFFYFEDDDFFFFHLREEEKKEVLFPRNLRFSFSVITPPELNSIVTSTSFLLGVWWRFSQPEVPFFSFGIEYSPETENEKFTVSDERFLYQRRDGIFFLFYFSWGLGDGRLWGLRGAFTPRRCINSRRENFDLGGD